MYPVLIPARLGSTRLPRKPLLDIGGIPMVVRTANISISVVGASNTFVVTDSDEISSVCDSYGIQSILTPERCLTGSDRISAASHVFNESEALYNLQGDEPFFSTQDMETFIHATSDDNKNYIGVTRISHMDELTSLSIPKCVMSSNKRLVYTSRSPIPGSKVLGLTSQTYKQVCIYKYNISDLRNCYGEGMPKTPLESIEDLEILRFLENDVEVNCIPLRGEGYSIDTPSDLERARKFVETSNA